MILRKVPGGSFCFGHRSVAHQRPPYRGRRVPLTSLSSPRSLAVACHGAVLAVALGGASTVPQHDRQQSCELTRSDADSWLEGRLCRAPSRGATPCRAGRRLLA